MHIKNGFMARTRTLQFTAALQHRTGCSRDPVYARNCMPDKVYHDLLTAEIQSTLQCTGEGGTQREKRKRERKNKSSVEKNSLTM